MQDSALLQRLIESRVFIVGNLVRRRADLARYRFLMETLRDEDVRTNAIYQRVFNGLYMVRRGHVWREVFYDLLETNKHMPEVDFGAVLGALYAGTGRIEASFASKLLATVDAGLPIYDSWVRINLSLPPRSGPAQPRIQALCEDYAAIRRRYSLMLSSSLFDSLRWHFDQALPDFAGFSDIKKLDFLFWQAR